MVFAGQLRLADDVIFHDDGVDLICVQCGGGLRLRRLAPREAVMGILQLIEAGGEVADPEQLAIAQGLAGEGVLIPTQAQECNGTRRGELSAPATMVSVGAADIDNEHPMLWEVLSHLTAVGGEVRVSLHLGEAGVSVVPLRVFMGLTNERFPEITLYWTLVVSAELPDGVEDLIDGSDRVALNIVDRVEFLGG